MAACCESLTAQHSRICIKSLRIVGYILSFFFSSHAFPILSQDEFGMGRVWIQSHICFLQVKSRIQSIFFFPAASSRGITL